ncbi:N-acyl-D-amino-acid deacylase family protein [Novosphingobium cyanobacteriorum]|uniref:Amidohydrolase family protein n=1 Tax=Novosphingobium cyanobacteriorum TaxID=3024215 RepID=A0ABT6CE69_9SPHN|nr:amidohydrolase family protein [Novosphingobium cyanobacteriorum]MDF8332214.1 amidohydrolase family protein [Novosphingobium cyanobacteriorum]
MAEFDLIITGGTIIDGTRFPRYVGDVAVRDGKIAEIGGKIDAKRGARTIDATGRIVAPGVIDPHTHYDAQIFWDPYCADSSWHGNTTFVVGNCGFGFMPCRPEDRERYMLMMENTEQVPLAAMKQALPWTWESFPEWMATLRSLAKGVNIAAYMPLNSLMIYVMGIEAAKSRGATHEERLEMRRLLNEAMDAGAIGFGFSFLNDQNSHKDIDGSPMPSDSMRIEDAYYLAEVLRERGEGVIQCLCELPPGRVSNRFAVEEMARISGRPVLLNIITALDGMPDYHRSLLDWLDEMETKGLNVYGQAFVNRSWNQLRAIEYDVWQGTSPSFLEFNLARTAEGKAAIAADPAFVARAVEEYDPAMWSGAGGPIETFKLVDAQGAVGYSKYNGKLLGEIAAAEGKHAIEVFFAIIAESGCYADFRTTLATSEDPDKACEILQHKRVVSGTSDGGAHVKFHCGGQYATDNIMWLARDEKRISLEDLHYSLSYLPARLYSFANRGALLEGYAADLYIYDFATIGYDREQYVTANILPEGDWRRVCPAQGIEWVIVNGEPILHNGEITGATPGAMLGVRGAQFDRDCLADLRIAAE